MRETCACTFCHARCIPLFCVICLFQCRDERHHDYRLMPLISVSNTGFAQIKITSEYLRHVKCQFPFNVGFDLVLRIQHKLRKNIIKVIQFLI